MKLLKLCLLGLVTLVPSALAESEPPDPALLEFLGEFESASEAGIDPTALPLLDEDEDADEEESDGEEDDHEQA